MVKRISKKTKLSAALLMLVLVVAGSIGATLALYTDKTDVLNNQFTVASITTDIEEKFEKKTDTDFTKEIKVKNTGTGDCLVRVRLEVTPDDQKSNIKIDDKDFATWQANLGTDWKYADGYYYYTKALPAGQSTANLMNKVTINDVSEMENFDIIVYQEAVQTAVYKNSVPGLTEDIVFNSGDGVAKIQAIFNAYK